MAVRRTGLEAMDHHIPIDNRLIGGELIDEPLVDADAHHLHRAADGGGFGGQQARLHGGEGNGAVGGQSIGIAQAGIAVHAAGHVNGDGDRLGGVDLAEQGAHIIGQISVKADTVYCVYHQLRFPHSAGCHIWLGLQIENGNAKAFHAAIHLPGLGGLWLTAQQYGGHREAFLRQLTGHDKAVAAVVAAAAENDGGAARQAVQGADPPGGGASRVFHQPAVIQAFLHRRRFQQTHASGCQHFHGVHPFRIFKNVSAGDKKCGPPFMARMRFFQRSRTRHIERRN